MERSDQVDSRPSQNSRALKVIMLMFALIFFLAVVFFTLVSNGIIESPLSQLKRSQKEKDNSQAQELAERGEGSEFSRPQIFRKAPPAPIIQQAYDDSAMQKRLAELNEQLAELKKQLAKRPKTKAEKKPSKYELRRARLLKSSFSGESNIDSSEIDATMSGDDDNRLAKYQRQSDAYRKLVDEHSKASRGSIGGGNNISVKSGNSEKTVRQSQVGSKSQVETVFAGRMQHSNLTLTAGSTVPCVLITKIISSLAGLITCQVSRDVYSVDGSTVLIDKGSFVLGEYKSGTVALGQGRLFVVWNRLRTPAGVVIDLASPGVGNLGESGVGGLVDRHYLEKFKGASFVALLSTITSMTQLIAEIEAKKALSSNTLDVNVDFSTEENAMDRVYADMLADYANIPPNIIKNQGDTFNIMVAHDVLFTDVYDYDWAHRHYNQ